MTNTQDWNRLFLDAKGFNTDLVYLLPSYVIVSNVHVCSSPGTISHVHGRAPKTVLGVHEISCPKN